MGGKENAQRPLIPPAFLLHPHSSGVLSASTVQYTRTALIFPLSQCQDTAVSRLARHHTWAGHCAGFEKRRVGIYPRSSLGTLKKYFVLVLEYSTIHSNLVSQIAFLSGPPMTPSRPHSIPTHSKSPSPLPKKKKKSSINICHSLSALLLIPPPAAAIRGGGYSHPSPTQLSHNADKNHIPSFFRSRLGRPPPPPPPLTTSGSTPPPRTP